jgi:hypothetical protein
MVSGGIAPPVQRAQMRQTNWVGRIGARQVKGESKTFKILRKVLDVWVTMIESPMGRELGLDQHLEACSNFQNDHLRAFRIQISAKALKMRAQQEHVPAQILID